MSAVRARAASIRLSGPIGVADALQLRTRLAELTSVARPQITIDLRDACELHLAAVNCLVMAAVETAASAGSLSIAATPGPVRDLLELAGLGGWIQ